MLGIPVIALIITATVAVIGILTLIIKQYKICPPSKMLVIFGKGGAKDKSCKIVHGGSSFILPFFQSYSFMDLRPRTVNVNFSKGALSAGNIRVNVPSNFNIKISSREDLKYNAAECLLGVDDDGVLKKSEDIIVGAMRAVISGMEIEAINKDREVFQKRIEEEVVPELKKIGIELINVNIEDISDEVGYIKDIGEKAAAEARNNAAIGVAEKDKIGAIGVANATKERATEVAEAESLQAIKVAESLSRKEQGTAEADAERRKRVMAIEAGAVSSENKNKAEIADSEAELISKQASARKKAQVADAEAATAILEAEKTQELAAKEKEEVVQVEIDKKKAILRAEAEAEQIMIVAKAKADAIVLEKDAEAKGEKAVLTARAEGFKMLFSSVTDESLVPAMVLVEHMPLIMEKQAEAIRGVKIDSISIIENGGGSKEGSGALSNFLKDYSSAIPGMHAAAKSVGIELPGFMGTALSEAKQAKASKENEEGTQA